MKSVDIKDLGNIEADLNNLGQDDVLFVCEGGKERFVLMPIEQYDALFHEVDDKLAMPQIKILKDGVLDLSYEDYDRIRKELLEAFDKALKPKAEKLN